MIDYKKLLELKKRGLSGHAIAKTLGCKWDTVQRIVSRCENYWGDLESVPDSLSNADIADAIFVKRFKADEDYLQPDCELILEKQRHGKLRNELWIEYSAEAVRRGKKAYKISQFNSIVSAFRTSNDIAFSITHEPGVEAQVDWCGDTGSFTDPRGGGQKKVYVFVCTLPYSGYFYAEGFPDMSMSSWIAGHKNAFEFFEGVPAVLTPDNCATAVDIRKHWWDDAILNTQYCAFAEHYGTLLKPARVKAPDDKGSVERSVGVAESDILPEMKKLTFFSLDEFNRILWKKLNTRLAVKYTKKDFSRKQIFLNEEQAKLLPLPACDFETYAEKTATVSRDFHIQFDSAFYSVPVEYIKNKVTVRATSSRVMIYNDRKELIADHQRATHRWQRCTDPKHIPEGHTPSVAYSRQAFINRAASYGDDLVLWVETVLGRFEFEVQGYRTVNTVLCSVRKYCPETVLQAARLANDTGVYSSKGFLTFCRQIEARNNINRTEEKPVDLNDIFCSHSSKEGRK